MKAFVVKTIKRWSEQGIKFPMAYDAITNKPSITLFFPYVAFIISVIAVILLIKENTLYGTIAAIGMWIVALVLYLMRRINKAKLDINDGEIEFEGGEDEPEKTI